jgi:hypothetical protein
LPAGFKFAATPLHGIRGQISAIFYSLKDFKRRQLFPIREILYIREIRG